MKSPRFGGRLPPAAPGSKRRALAAALLACLAVLATSSETCAATFVPLPLLASPQAVLDPTGDVARASWGAGPVRLAGARGETLALQVAAVLDTDERLEGLRLQAVFPRPLPCRVHRAWSIWGAPEVAVPVGSAGTDLPPGDLLDPQRARGRVWPLWLEVEIPRDQAPGPIEGTLRLSWNGGETSLPLCVEVYDFDLPPRPSFLLEMNSYGDFARLLPANPQTVLALHRLMRAFRCSFTLVPYRQSGEPVADFLAPRLARDKGGVRLDWRDFDRALSGLFDGQAFDDRQPVSHFLLPLAASWPDVASFGPEEQVAARRAIARHIREKGWTATRFQEFHNENPEHGCKAPWRLDEPVSDKDWDGHEMFAGWLNLAGQAGSDRSVVRYRIDCSLRASQADRYRKMFRHKPDWSLGEQGVNAKWIAFFREQGGEGLVLAYGELPGFHDHGRPTPMAALPARVAALSALGLDGFAQWIADRWAPPPGDACRLAPEAGPLVHANAAGARDFVWPGAYFGVNGPLPSLRLFALREGLNLIDYATLAAKLRPDQAEAIRAALASLNPEDPSQVPNLKRELAGMIAPACGRAP